MNARTLILAFVALSLAGATALFARHWLDNQRAAVAAAPVKKTEPAKEVLVAAKPIATGTFVKPDELKWQPWPEKGIAANYALKGKTELSAFVGSVARQDVAPGEPVTEARLVKPGTRGFLAAVLKPGLRAVSVPITAETGISGLVFPGDRVDLILAQGIRTANTEAAPMRRASETVLTDLRVLAIDQRTSDGDHKPAVGKTVTLEVTPKQAEDVAVAEQLGKLSLSLRSLATEDPVVASRGRGVTWDNQVSAVVGRSFGGPQQIQVVHGAKSEAVPTAASAASMAPHPTPAAPGHNVPVAAIARGAGSSVLAAAKAPLAAAPVAAPVLP